MTRFTVDSDAVDSAAAAIGATVSRLQSEVTALHGQLDALQGVWTGGAAVAFQGVVQQWRTTQTSVEQVLGIHRPGAARRGPAVRGDRARERPLVRLTPSGVCGPLRSRRVRPPGRRTASASEAPSGVPSGDANGRPPEDARPCWIGSDLEVHAAAGVGADRGRRSAPACRRRRPRW